MNAREVLEGMIRTDRGDMTVHSPVEVQSRLDAYRAEVLAEHDGHVRAATLAEVTAWLIKKAREFHASSRKAERAQGDTCAVLASQIARGAVRPNNLRMLPNAGFFEVDHTYTDAHHFRFECHAVGPTPWDGTLRAIGYLTHPDGSGHVCGLAAEQWADGDWNDTTDTTRGDHT